MQERLGLPAGTGVNISLIGDLDDDGESLLCWDGGTTSGDNTNTDVPGLFEQGSTECNAEEEDDTDVLSAGPRSGEQGDAVVTARRTATLHGKTVTIRVSVW